MSKSTTIKHPVPGDLHLPFQALEKDMRTVLFERREEIHTAILALLGRQHHFVLGAPGTGKSFMTDQLCARIEGARHFSIVLNRFSQPEEVFGGPDVKKLAETGEFDRVTKGMVPEADIAFMDEIFKANPAILNAQLKLMNERRFNRGHGVVEDVPLHTLFAASNELADSEELGALWDRLHYRHFTSPIQETTNFVKMLGLSVSGAPQVTMSMEAVRAAHAVVKQVEIPEDVYEGIVNLKATLLGENIEVSDRRWREAIMSIKSEAFYQGHMVAGIDDLRPLQHFLWGDPEQIKKVRQMVLELANPLEKEGAELLDSLNEAHEVYKKKVSDSDNTSTKAQLAIEVFNKLEKAKEQYRILKSKQAKTGRESDILDQLGEKLSQLAVEIYEALNLKED